MAADLAISRGSPPRLRSRSFSVSSSGTSQRTAKLDLGLEGGEEALVVPGLLNVVASPAPHGLDRALHAAPRSHHDNGKRRVQVAESGQEVEALSTRRGVAGVVQVDERGVEFALPDPGQRLCRTRCHLGGKTRRHEEKSKRLDHVRLVVGDQDPPFHAGRGASPVSVLTRDLTTGI